MKTSDAYSFFSVDAYDPASGFPVREVYLENFSKQELPPDVQNAISTLNGNEVDDLDPASLQGYPRLQQEVAYWHTLPLRISHDKSNLPYRNHGGREFDLMSKGLKPFAFFSHPSEPHLAYLRKYFAPMVNNHSWIMEKEVCGEIEGKELIRYMYALPGEEWRIKLFRLIHSRTKWSDALERIEGFLLGYTSEQSDLWFEYLKQRGRRWGLQRTYKFITPEEEQFLEATGHRVFMPLRADAPPVVLYYPQVEDNYEAALATLQPLKLARFYAPLAKLREFSRGVSTIAGVGFGVYELPKPELVRLNRVVSGTIEIIEAAS